MRWKSEESRARSLANLRRGGPGRKPYPKMLSALEAHLRTITPASPHVQAVLHELLSWQHELAKPTEADLPLLASLAQVLVVQRLALADVLRGGIVDGNGKERAAAKILLSAADVAGRLCDRLAIGPAARSKLGVGEKLPSLAEALARTVHAAPDAAAGGAEAPHPPMAEGEAHSGASPS